MSKIENGPSEPNLNNPEINPSKIGGDVNIGENLETNLPPESGLESLETEGEQLGEQQSPEEQLEKLSDRIDNLQEMAGEDREEFDKAREELGLPLSEESLSTENELEKLKTEQETLKQQQEKEILIQEEKEKILQEKLSELFNQFESFSVKDFKAILKSGMESSPIGSMDKNTAKSLVKAFREGIKLLPQILEKLPDILKKSDEDLMKEAIERVEKQLEEDKKETEEQEEKPEDIKLEEKVIEQP